MTPTGARIKLEELQDMCACYERAIERVESRLLLAQEDVTLLKILLHIRGHK